MTYTIVTHQSDTDAWLAARRTGIGASSIAVVLGVSPWSSPYALYSELTGEVEREPMDAERVEWGLVLEDVVRQQYGKRTQRPTRASGVLLRSDEHPWALATLDAWVQIGDDDCPLEIKTSGVQSTSDWEDGPPRHYLAQVQQQLLVTGAPRASIACLLGGQRLVWQDVERDEDMIAWLVREGSAFWGRVQRREPPPVDGREATTRALRSRYPRDDGEVLELDAAALDLDEEIVRCKVERKQLEERIAAAENAIKSAIGSATIGTLPSGVSYAWKASERAGYTVAPTTVRTLRRTAPKR